MISLIPWTQREFEFNLSVGVFPSILERLRGTPARAAEIVEGVAEGILSTRIDGKWSAKEHLGHLVDLDALDQKRLQEFLNHVAKLSAADIRNQETEDAGHRSTSIAEILSRLRRGRQNLVLKLELLTEADVAIAAVHPRLRKPMRLLDWAWFVAEHDDHHLVQTRRAIQKHIDQQASDAS